MVQTERILRTASPHLAGQERAFRAVPRTPRAVLGRSIGRCWRRRLLFPRFLREFGCWRDSQEFNSSGFLKEWFGLCAWPTFLGLVSWVRFPPCCAMPTSIRSASPGAGDIELALEDIARADADCIGALTCGRSSFSYHRLPEPRLRLTIRKLDASYFDVQIARSAAVWELKAAIESLFIALYDDTEKAISWQHVWSHFCLCFKDEKLIDDKATLRAFGIRDGDELHFAQHLSVNYSPCKSLSKNHKAASHRRSRTSLDDFSVRSSTLLDDLIEDEGEKKFTDTRRSTSVLEEGLCVYPYSEECMEEGRKKGSFFRGWFSYSRLRSNRTHSEDVVQSSCEKKGTRPKLGKWLSSKKSKVQNK